MIDRAYVDLALRKTEKRDGEFTPEQAIAYRKHHLVGSNELAVVIPPWHRSNILQTRMTQRLNASGYDVIDYGFHPSILSTDTQRVVDAHQFASESITDDIETQTNDMGYERVHLMTMSMGFVCLSLVATKLENFDTATTVVSGSNLADGLWEGIRTQHLRQSLEEQGVTQDGLREKWSWLAPSRHAPSFAGKVVNFCISLNDEIVPTSHQLDLQRALSDADADVRSRTLKVGHVLSPPVYYLASNKLPVADRQPSIAA